MERRERWSRISLGRDMAVLMIALAACGKSHGSDTASRESVKRGKQQIVAYGCGTCHVIPGIRRANGLVGPPLDHFARRAYIAGQVPNNPDMLIQWIAVPQSIEPGTAMPNLGVSYGKARDIAAYLYTLK